MYTLDMKKQITTDEAPQAPMLLSQAIEVNGTIYVSGQIHNTIDGTVIDGSVEEKMKQIMQNIEAVLKAASATLEDIVKVTVYVTDMAQMPELNKVYPTFFSEPYPAREAVCVKELPLGATIEISVTATKP
jgi:2-iminobutanoate/2-iminopropanoate deaminase